MKMFNRYPEYTQAQSCSWQLGGNSYLFLRTHCTATGDRMPNADDRRHPTLAKDPRQWSALCGWFCAKQDLHPHIMTPPQSPPLLFLFALYVLNLLAGRFKWFRFPLSSRHSLEHLWLTRVFHFFPTPLVTFDLECRFLLLEEWLSLLPECLGGLSSEPFAPFLWGQEISGL